MRQIKEIHLFLEDIQNKTHQWNYACSVQLQNVPNKYLNTKAKRGYVKLPSNLKLKQACPKWTPVQLIIPRAIWRKKMVNTRKMTCIRRAYSRGVLGVLPTP